MTTAQTWGARSLVAASLLCLVTWAGAISAGAGQQITPTVNPTSVAPGEQFTVSGSPDCIEGTTLIISVPQLSLSDQASGDSSWSVRFTVPVDTPPDTYLITVDGECTYGDTNVVVTAALPTTTTTTAAPTVAVAAGAASATPAFTG